MSRVSVAFAPLSPFRFALRLFAAAGLGALATPSFAALDLGALHTQTVKAGQPWMQIDTEVKSLDLDIAVNGKVVTTRAAIEYVPGKGKTWVNEGCDSLRPDRKVLCTERVLREISADSLETTTGFRLADNIVLTDMWLWVGSEKVRAALQERGLASAQYESIVKRRQDPALLETWGNGHYNLRIFPTQSGLLRRIEIEFVQGLEDDSAGFTALLPVQFRGQGYYGGADSLLPLGKVSLTARAVDGMTYDLSWPGLGRGSVGATPLKLSAQGLKTLSAGRLSAPVSNAPGLLHAWQALKGPTAHFGVKALLTNKSLAFDPEPKERLVILDVEAGQETKDLDRAKKLALLSLKAYGAAPFTSNLFLISATGSLEAVFPAPVSMDGPNLRKAYDRLLALRPAAKADADRALRALLSTLPVSVPQARALILIDNGVSASFAEPYPSGSWPQNRTAVEAWQKRQNAFERGLAAKYAALSGALLAKKASLFGFWNDYRLSTAARPTGGYQLGYLGGWYYRPLPVDAAAEGGKPAPAAGTAGGAPDIAPEPAYRFPALFGPGRAVYGSDLVGLDVAAAGAGAEGLVVLEEEAGYGYYGPRLGGIAIDLVAGPGYGYSAPRDSVVLRIAGKNRSSGRVTLDVSGRKQGLPFKTRFETLLGAAPANAPGAALWAFQQGEAWARGTAYPALDSIAPEILALGKSYHVVTRQTSLLALEPGMKLWDSLPARTEEARLGGRESNDLAAPPAGIPAADGKGGQNNLANIDQLSLEQILTAEVSGLVPGRGAGGLQAGRFEVRSRGGRVEFRLKGGAAGQGLAGVGAAGAGAQGLGLFKVRITGLDGRAVATLEGRQVLVFEAGSRHGTFIAVLEGAGLRETVRFTVLP